MPYQYLTFFMEDDEELKRIGETLRLFRVWLRRHLVTAAMVACCIL